MPFTLSHAALVLPLRRWLPLDALVIGSMAPDFEYLVRLEPKGSAGHALPWCLTWLVPGSLLVLMGWRAFLPHLRLCLSLSPNVVGEVDLLRALPAVSIGVLGHLAWDCFTHRSSDGIAFLRVSVLAGWPVYRVLQHLSSLAGLDLCLASMRGWLRRQRSVPCFRRSLLRLLVPVQSGACMAGLMNAYRGGTYREQAGLFATAWLAGAVVLLVACVLLRAWALRSGESGP